MKNKILILGLSIAILSCTKKKDEVISSGNNTPGSANVNFTVAFDNTLPRLNNLGNPSNIPAGNAAQNPMMNSTSIHYIEIAENATTLLGDGEILYHGAETTMGGNNAVDFDQAEISANNEAILSVNVSDLTPGTYNWLRVSLTYQNYNINAIYTDATFGEIPLTATVASFVGFNNYITSHKIKDSTITLNSNKLQGYWAVETSLNVFGQVITDVQQGEDAGVTVVNPIANTSPVPAGSCVVTGMLETPLVITGNETENIDVVIAFSTNNSFEWVEVNFDGKFEPLAGETIVDMGLRGLHPYIQEK